MSRNLPHSLRYGTATTCLMAMYGLFAMPAFAASPNAGIEAKVRKAFADAPVMIQVAKCESGFRQFASEEVVLRGGAGKGYIGIFQIGERIHTARAEKMGLDIMTVEGNIAYAHRLYDTNGTIPWRECIPKDPTTVSATTTVTPPPATRPAPAVSALTDILVLGAKGPQVAMLQKLLNAKGFAIAASGPGSPGNETDFFGGMTREALRRFQCAQKIACDGTESTTGYGRVGPKTRAALQTGG